MYYFVTLFIQKKKYKNISHEDFIQKHYSIKFYKFILQDLETCPFVAIVYVGTHNYPPPPPEKIPADIKLNLQTLTAQAIENNDTITHNIFNQIKFYFLLSYINIY